MESKEDLIKGLRNQGVSIKNDASLYEIRIQYQNLYNIYMYRIGQLMNAAS
jgi:hypothetical protein